MSFMTFFQAIRLVAVAVLLATVPAIAQKATTTNASLPPPSNGNEIMPPFSLVWHEPSERLEGKIEAAKLVVEDRRKIGNRMAMIVSGFKKPNPTDPKAPKPP